MSKPTNFEKSDNTNRPAEADELDFERDEPTPNLEDPRSAQGYDPGARNAGLTEASQPGEGPTNDDLAKEILIAEDGARSQHEPEQGNIDPTDKTLSIVRDNEIGGGSGLDEAELAEVDPLNRRKVSRKK
jgi:hypothetical protein